MGGQFRDIKRSPVAWFASHRHSSSRADEPYSYGYLFAYAIDVPANAKSLTFPDNSEIRILAVTATNDTGDVRPAQPLYEVIEPN